MSTVRDTGPLHRLERARMGPQMTSRPQEASQFHVLRQSRFPRPTRAPIGGRVSGGFASLGRRTVALTHRVASA